MKISLSITLLLLVVSSALTANEAPKNYETPYKRVKLAGDPFGTQYFVEVGLKDTNTWMQVDTGASRSSLSLDGVRALKLDFVDKGSTVIGINGVEKVYDVIIPALTVAEGFTLPARSGRALNKQFAPLSIDGQRVISYGQFGIDHLSELGAVIDYATDTLILPQNGTYTVDPTTLDSLQIAPLQVLDKIVTVLMAKVAINDKDVLFVIDTGAQQTTIDNALAQSMGLEVLDIGQDSVGIGSEQTKVFSAEVPEFRIADTTIERFPMLVSDLSGLGFPEIKGILGVDFLKATKALFDTGNPRLLWKNQSPDIHPHIEWPAGFIFDEETLQEKYNDSAAVLAIELTKIKINREVTATAEDGTPLLGLTIRSRVTEVFKGNPLPPSGNVSILEKIFLVSADKPGGEPLTSELQRLGRGHRKIVFLPKSNSPPQIDVSIFPDSPFRRKELRAIAEKSEPTAAE